jgi:hypothetical protein
VPRRWLSLRASIGSWRLHLGWQLFESQPFNKPSKAFVVRRAGLISKKRARFVYPRPSLWHIAGLLRKG